jgi:dTDP-4-dehydrorhamnose 3,5-epimerase
MRFHATPISGLFVAETTPFTDERGSFARLFCDQELAEIFGDRKVTQINQSITRSVGAIRGLHFQTAPHAEMKLVRCLEGRVWDVAVDLRKDSPTFLQWHAEELSPSDMKMMVIPEGFAHGFQTLEPNSRLLYLHTASYAPSAEGGVRFDDPMVDIAWPRDPVDLSSRDALHPLLKSGFEGISV